MEMNSLQGASPGAAPLLEVRDLRTSFFTDQGEVKAVDGVNFVVHQGETLGIVGESGCGKSITSLSIMRLLSAPGRIVGGDILLRGESLLPKSEHEMRALRGQQISMIFQEPMTSLNPVFTVGEQIAEAIRIHDGLDRRAAMAKAIDMLDLVGIPSPRSRAAQYPFQLSGGMRQRVMIAIAIACNPALLIADEPTTALDVTIQAQILDLLKRLQQEFGLAILLITHDLGVVAQTCDNVAVMYAGKIVENNSVEALFERPLHPYTIGLLNSLPLHVGEQDELNAIPGSVPTPLNLPSGCTFAPRCTHATPFCHANRPTLTPEGSGTVSCWMYTPQWAAARSEQEAANE